MYTIALEKMFYQLRPLEACSSANGEFIGISTNGDFIGISTNGDFIGISTESRR